MIAFRDIGEALAPVEDPEIGVSLSDLGLIYGAAVSPHPSGEGSQVRLEMSLTSPGCPYAPQLMGAVHEAVAAIPGVRHVDVNLSFDPIWDPERMATDDAKDELGIF